MKLTTEQIREIIRQELAEVYKGKKRIFYAPKTKGHPDMRWDWEETGAYALPAEDPYGQLDPEVKAKIPRDSDDEDLRQAYELSSMLGSEPEDDVEDFIQGIKMSKNPELARQEAIDELKKYIKAEKVRAYALPKGEEREKLRRSINAAMIRLNKLMQAKDLESAYK
jgi:hypothetical protein